jgi:hypothetical protein
MILIDYFLYKIYSFFLNKPFWETTVANNVFLLLLFINIGSLLDYLGYPIWDKNWRYSLIGGYIIGNILLWFFYEKKGRYKKIYEKYKNESKTWSIIGWILIFSYITATVFFMGHH